MWTASRARKEASPPARFGMSNVWLVPVSWKRRSCCLKSFWDTPIISGCIRKSLVQTAGTSATFPRRLRISRSLARRLIWTELSPVETMGHGVKHSHRNKNGAELKILRFFVCRPIGGTTNELHLRDAGVHTQFRSRNVARIV